MAVTSNGELREVHRPPAPRAAQKALADQIAGARETGADEGEANRERLY